MSIFFDKRPYFGQDPFVVPYNEGFLLIESEDDRRIAIKTIHDLDNITQNVRTVVWESPREYEVWAPEIHQLDGRWYIYYSSSNGDNKEHRNYVIEAPSPFGPYIRKTRLGLDAWGIDLTIFEHHGTRYAAWSGWDLEGNQFPQHLYAAKLINPEKIGVRHRISSPDYPWEMSRAAIMEGPQAICHNGKLLLTYSANASWTQDYCIGALELTGNDPLSPDSWTKHPKPLLLNAGHGCFVNDTFIYHRKQGSFPGWQDREIVTLSTGRLLENL